MISRTGLPHLLEYVNSLNSELEQQGHRRISQIQTGMLMLVLLGMSLTQSLCWARIERISGGAIQDGTLSKWFYHGMKCWAYILRISSLVVIKRFGIKSGVLVFDDTDRGRSKNTDKIWGVHKTVLKGTGGFHFAQNVVFLILVTPTISIPVGFEFYRPDPEVKKWKNRDAQLRSQGMKKKDRPKRPSANPDFPSREEIACTLAKEFHLQFPNIKVKAITADNAYFTQSYVERIEKIYTTAQILSQIRSNQKVKFRRGKTQSIESFFKNRKWETTTIRLRGHRDTIVHHCSSVLHVESHNRKYRVVAVRFGDEKEPRFIVANDLSWLSQDIVRYYALRWLVEVFIEDWKQHHGWGKLAYQQAEDGARRGLLLSLLLDHSLFFHAQQTTRIKHNLPALTVGSLRSAINNESLISTITKIVNDEDPIKSLESFKIQLQQSQIYNFSTKHLSGRVMKNFTNENSSETDLPLAA